jgi:hypothetical protein
MLWCPEHHLVDASETIQVMLGGLKTILWTVENNHPLDTLNQECPIDTFESAQLSLHRWGG